MRSHRIDSDRFALAEMDSHERNEIIATPVAIQLLAHIPRLGRHLLSLPRTPRVISNRLTEIVHMRALAELRDLESRKEHLRREIDAAQRELMRLSGKEAMQRHKLRMM